MYFQIMTTKKSSSRRRSRPVEPKKLSSNRKTVIILSIILLIIVIVAVVFYLDNITSSNENNGSISDGNPIAVIDTTKGIIKIELFEEKVPKTCDNFIKLANDGFYNGLIFHRVQDNFMIQGGYMLPDGSTKTSPYGSIDLEIHPDVRHVDGAISMARTTDPNSATSQFFICDGPQNGLDDQYATFGVVIEGIEVVRDIADEPHDGSFGSVGGGKPTEGDIIINSIFIQ
jgi:cyclophilin family peptidyl-prolyl cis-trans isomerase